MPDKIIDQKNSFTPIATSSDEEMYELEVKGKERYEMLKKINESLEICDMIPQSDKDKYLKKLPSKKRKYDDKFRDGKKGRL